MLVCTGIINRSCYRPEISNTLPGDAILPDLPDGGWGVVVEGLVERGWGEGGVCVCGVDNSGGLDPSHTGCSSSVRPLLRCDLLTTPPHPLTPAHYSTLHFTLVVFSLGTTGIL